MSMDTEGEKPTDAGEQDATTRHVDFDELSFVMRSRYRVLALTALDDGPEMPSRAAEKSGLDGMAHMSRALIELKERGLVELLVDEETKKGRFYGLTADGEALLPHVDAEEGV